MSVEEITMPSRTDSPNRSETFGRLLSGAINSIATYEGRTAPTVEEGLGQLLNLSGKTVQRYKAGYLPPEDRTVEILAEAAIKRGYLGREWLGRFLHAARYPFADKLLDRLCPLGPARPRLPRIYHNLPAPTYSQFVMRAQAFADVIDGLGQRSAVVLIVGLGGNGKTSLAREVAARCLMQDGNIPRFDAAVWVSDKDRPGTTNLSLVLDEIACTLDYPGFTQFAHGEKLYEVGQLLKRQRVLLVVDNFETITDGALLTWLLRLPEPSKAIITTREYHREYRRGGWPIELRGMIDDEARALITERQRVLKLEKLAGDQAQFEPFVAATGGNPKAIELTLGLMKYEHRTVQQVVDDLYAARGDLFDDLFTRAWALLDEAARRVLLVMTFFPASASGDALSATADVQGFSLDRVIERLTDLALLDVQQADLSSHPRYALHPLVRAFAKARLVETTDFEREARKRWVRWYVQLAAKVGDTWQDMSKLELLDPEIETADAVARWALVHDRNAEAFQLADRVGYYYYVRGGWDRKLAINLLQVEAARLLGHRTEEVQALSFSIQLLCICGEMADVEAHLTRLRGLVQGMQLSADEFAMVQHTLAQYWMAHGDLLQAQRAWQASLSRAEELSPPACAWTRRWLATCLYKQGRLIDAQQLFRAALDDAIRLGYQRSIVFNKVKLAAVHLEQRQLDDALTLLAESRLDAQQYKDRVYLAEVVV
jgi:hypothetical protein